MKYIVIAFIKLAFGLEVIVTVIYDEIKNKINFSV